MSRVWTKVVSRWDEQLQRYVTVESESECYEYSGPVALCKGDETAKQTELMQQQNMAAQMQFNQQLMGLFQQQYAKQQGVLDYLEGKMKPIIEKPTGFSDEALAAMRTSATDQLSTAYNNAQKALNAKQFTEGSRDLPSGVTDQLNAALLQSEASDKANTQNSITLQDEQLKQANYWNALNVLSGVGAQFNPQSYAGAATNAANSAVAAGNSVADLSQAYKASQSGFWSNLAGSFGSSLGSGLGGALAGGKGGISALFCWVAAAIYGGWEAPETIAIQDYLTNDFGLRWYGKPVVWLYAKTGEWVSRQPVLVWALKPLFALALRKAQESKKCDGTDKSKR